MKKILIILITIVLLFCACENISNKPEIQIAPSQTNILQEIPSPENTEKGEKIMNDRLITKDEFLNYVEENQHLETVDITLNDLTGIDIDDFIAHWHFTKDNIKSKFLKIALESYLENSERNKKAEYMAKEKFCVESTDEEYEKFKGEFLKAINKEVISSGKELGFNWFDINDEKKTTLYIAQTKYINEFNFFDNPNSYPKLLEVFIENGPDGAGIKGNFCYSKNKKYIMLVTNPYDEQLFEYVKVFCEIDD